MISLGALCVILSSLWVIRGASETTPIQQGNEKIEFIFKNLDNRKGLDALRDVCSGLDAERTSELCKTIVNKEPDAAAACYAIDLMADASASSSTIDFLQSSIRNHPEASSSQFAQLRLGDLFAKQSNDDAAIGAYLVSLKKFPQPAHEKKIHEALAKIFSKTQDYRKAAIIQSLNVADRSYDNTVELLIQEHDADVLYRHKEFSNARDKYSVYLARVSQRPVKDIAARDAYVEYMYLLSSKQIGTISENEARKIGVYGKYLKHGRSQDIDAILESYPDTNTANLTTYLLEIYSSNHEEDRTIDLLWKSIERTKDNAQRLNRVRDLLRIYKESHEQLSALYENERQHFRTRDQDSEKLNDLQKRETNTTNFILGRLKTLASFAFEDPNALDSSLLDEFADLFRFLEGYDDLISLYAALLERTANDDVRLDTLFKLADLSSSRNYDDKAIKAYKTILNDYPTNSKALEAQKKVISIYRDKWKLYDKAVEEERVLQKTFPDSADAVASEFNIGKIYYDSKEPKKAIFELMRFIESTSDANEQNAARMLIGLSYVQLEENEKARNMFREVLRTSPDGQYASKAQFLLGYTYVTEQKYGEATLEFEKLVQYYPESKEFEEAKRFLEKLSSLKELTP
jgi:TolA-binding protein